MMDYGRRDAGTGFAVRAIVAALIGMPTEQFVEAEMARLEACHVCGGVGDIAGVLKCPVCDGLGTDPDVIERDLQRYEAEQAEDDGSDDEADLARIWSDWDRYDAEMARKWEAGGE
jgi:RecJ-like exonuclease